MEKNRQLKFNWSTAEFEENANKFIAKLQIQSTNLVVKLAADYVGSAVIHTPPSLGKRAIEKRFWTRPILSLKKLINYEYENYVPIYIDIAKFQSGMRWKVMDNKKGKQKTTPYAYTKSLAEAKKAAVIETRGLARVMWGKNLPNINSKIPTSIQNIFNKAPKLMSLDYNKIEKKKTEDQTSVQIKNSANSVSHNTMLSAMHFADKKVENTMMRQLKNMMNQNKEL